MNKIRRYSELKNLKTFEERYNYLKLGDAVGIDTFGFDRYLNQRFYKSKEWKRVRDQVIIRDNGCDLGLDGYEIGGRILIHHMNPITIDDITNKEESILNPEFLICVTHDTHNAIHYGKDYLEEKLSSERSAGDTKLW